MVINLSGILRTFRPVFMIQMAPEKKVKEGRISVIAWGWTDQKEI